MIVVTILVKVKNQKQVKCFIVNSISHGEKKIISLKKLLGDNLIGAKIEDRS